jgi:hypothetical protein
MMEYWARGEASALILGIVEERRSIGPFRSQNPLLHYSNIPLFHCARQQRIEISQYFNAL